MKKLTESCCLIHLGILDPDETYDFCNEMIQTYPDVNFDFHAHNDYDLAIANVFHAIKAGMRCVHTTVNGLGERAGNAPLSSVIATVKDHLKIKTKVNETHLNKVSKLGGIVFRNPYSNQQTIDWRICIYTM